MAARGYEIDRGWKKLVRNFSRAAPDTVATVGVQGPAAEKPREGGITNAGLAAVHEFGSPPVPERSFFRSAFDANKKKYEAEMPKIAKAVLDGASLEGALRLLGEMNREDVINKVRSNIPPPLSEKTIARKKGEATALIESGEMVLQSISVEVKSGKKVQREAA